MKRLKFVRYDNRKHFDSMFLYMSDVEEQRMFLTYTSANSVREFENWLENQLRSYYKEFFVIEDNNELIGFVYSYEHHMRDGHCKIGIYIAPQWRVGGIGAVAGLQMMHYIFYHYPMRRINCDVYEYNTPSLMSLLQCGFERMGIWKEYRFYTGKYYDLILLSMTREFYMEKYERFFSDQR